MVYSCPVPSSDAMTDKYTLKLIQWRGSGGRSDYHLMCSNEQIAMLTCSEDIAKLIDNALNATSRAGSKTSQAKRDAAKSNIAKRWQHVETLIEVPFEHIKDC